jgi:hypothetical protein
MNRPLTRTTGAVAAAGIAAVHLLLAPEYLAEKAYVGVLFVVGGIASALVAIRLWRADHALSWALGSLVAAGMAAGLLLSRTIGLPGFYEGEGEPSAVFSLLLEGAFLVAAGYALRRRRPLAVG